MGSVTLGVSWINLLSFPELGVEWRINEDCDDCCASAGWIGVRGVRVECVFAFFAGGAAAGTGGGIFDHFVYVKVGAVRRGSAGSGRGDCVVEPICSAGADAAGA